MNFKDQIQQIFGTTDTLENLKILQDVMGKTKGFLERK